MTMMTSRRMTTRWTRTRRFNLLPSFSGLALMSTSDVHLMENRLRWIYEYYENKKYHGGVSVDYVNTGILDGIRRLLDGWPDAQASDLGAMTD